jgi:hypothetical protein
LTHMWFRVPVPICKFVWLIKIDLETKT